jgi:hypothetical protein
MAIPTAGSNTINFFLVNADGTDLMKDNQGNPIVASITVNALPAQVTQTTQSAQVGPPLVVTITTASNAYPATINPSSFPIQLSGTVTGGTPPYTITWFAAYTWNGPQMVTIVTGGSNDLNYAWTACPTLGSTAGTATILLKATDVNGATGQSPTSVTITFNCEVIQSLPAVPVMGMGLVSLLTALFAITGERLTPIVLKDRRGTSFSKSWFSW